MARIGTPPGPQTGRKEPRTPRTSVRSAPLSTGYPQPVENHTPSDQGFCVGYPRGYPFVHRPLTRGYVPEGVGHPTPRPHPRPHPEGVRDRPRDPTRGGRGQGVTLARQGARQGREGVTETRGGRGRVRGSQRGATGAGATRGAGVTPRGREGHRGGREGASVRASARGSPGGARRARGASAGEQRGRARASVRGRVRGARGRADPRDETTPHPERGRGPRRAGRASGGRCPRPPGGEGDPVRVLAGRHVHDATRLGCPLARGQGHRAGGGIAVGESGERAPTKHERERDPPPEHETDDRPSPVVVGCPGHSVSLFPGGVSPDGVRV